MDPVTHGLVGAFSAQSFSDKKTFRAASLVGFIAALAPDSDVLLGSSTDPLLTLELHRQFTHSFLFVPFGSFIVALGLFWFVRKQLTFRTTYGFSLAGYATAGLMDYVTSYGVFLYWPFLDERFSLNIVSVFDPFFTSLLLGIGFFAIKKKNKLFTLAAFVWIFFYLSVGFVQKKRVINTAQTALHSGQELVLKPTIGNQILWSVRYIENDALCGMGIRVGILSRPKMYQGECIPLIDWKAEYSEFEGSVLYHDIQRFSTLSDGFLIKHPHFENVLGDGRYSMLPTSLIPLWGITLDSSNIDQHVGFETFRDASTQNRNAFLEMILGE